MHERMSQGKATNGTQEKKKVIGWSTEETKEKPHISLERISTWRGLSQNEVDQCWKNLAGRMEEEVLEKL